MITGITLEQACLLLPSTQGTLPIRIREVLLPLGWRLGPRVRTAVRGGVYLGRVQWERHRHHGHLFVLDRDGRVLDPYFGVNPTWRTSAFVTSFYPVQPVCLSA